MINELKDKEFINKLYQDSLKEVLPCIDSLYECLDPILEVKDYKRIDLIIQMFVSRSVPFDLKIIVAFLTITKSHDLYLNGRIELLMNAYKAGELNGLDHDTVIKVLKGL